MAGRQGSSGSSNRGFAGMNKDEQRAIARKGGEAVSENREHMSEIGRKGAKARSDRRNERGGSEGRSAGSEDSGSRAGR